MNCLYNLLISKKVFYYFGLAAFCMVMGVGIFSNINNKVFADANSQAMVKHCTKGFFGLEPWYKFMGGELDPSNNCEVKCFNVLNLGDDKSGNPVLNDCGQNKSDIPLILIAVVDDLLRVSAILAIAFIIYGAFEYVGSQGNSEVTSRAQSMIINALIGLVIATIAVAAVSYIGSTIGSNVS